MLPKAFHYPSWCSRPPCPTKDASARHAPQLGKWPMAFRPPASRRGPPPRPPQGAPRTRQAQRTCCRRPIGRKVPDEVVSVYCVAIMPISDVTPRVCRRFPYGCRTVVGTSVALSRWAVVHAQCVGVPNVPTGGVPRWTVSLVRAPCVFIAAVVPLAFLAPRAFAAPPHRILSHCKDVRSLVQVVIFASALPLFCLAWRRDARVPRVARSHCSARRATILLLFRAS